MKQKSRVAVLILNYNGKAYLAACYRSLLAQTTKSYDIYLVDNASSDGSREYTKQKFPSVIIINTGGNLGFTGAYNLAVRKIIKSKRTYDFFLFLNNDTICDSNLLDRELALFDADPAVGIVTPTVIYPDKKIALRGGTFLPFSGTTTGHEVGKRYRRTNARYYSFWASGCALTIRSSLFVSLGMFPDYFIYYEDIDLSWRVRNAGFAVVTLGDTYVIHFQGRANTPSNLQLYLSERNRLLTYWQNLPSLLFFLILPIFLFIRFVLLGYMSSQFSHVANKLRGMKDAFLYMKKYPKRTYGIVKHLQILASMPKIQIVRT